MELSVVHFTDLLSLVGRGWKESELCRVHTINSWRYTVDISSEVITSYTVLDLKRHMEDVHGHALEDQIVRFKERVLENTETLTSCGVSSGKSVFLGLTHSVKEAPDSSGRGTRTALRSEQSKTVTVECDSEEPSDWVSSDAWWSTSRTSGPRGRDKTGSVSHLPGPLTVSLPLGTQEEEHAVSATVQRSQPTVEELRQLRLARFS